MLIYKQKIGDSIIEIQTEDIKSIFKFGALMGDLPQKCDACGSSKIHLSHKSPGGNNYYMIACADCGAEVNFHEKKEGGFYFVRGEKMEVYSGEKKTETKKEDKDIF